MMAIASIPTGAKLHKLKCATSYFRAIERGEKTFEVRLNDRGFSVGDILELVEQREVRIKDGVRIEDGDTLRTRVTYLLSGGQFGIAADHVVMSVRPIYATDEEWKSLKKRQAAQPEQKDVEG